MSWVFSKIFSFFTRNFTQNDDDKLILVRLQNELQRVREQNENVEVILVSKDLKEWKVAFKRCSSSNCEGFKLFFSSFHRLIPSLVF